MYKINNGDEMLYWFFSEVMDPKFEEVRALLDDP